MTYDSQRIAGFLKLAEGIEIDLFCGCLRASSSGPAIRAFEALTPWERANALYEMRDRVVAAVNERIRQAAALARAADERGEER